MLAVEFGGQQGWSSTAADIETVHGGMLDCCGVILGEGKPVHYDGVDYELPHHPLAIVAQVGGRFVGSNRARVAADGVGLAALLEPLPEKSRDREAARPDPHISRRTGSAR